MSYAPLSRLCLLIVGVWAGGLAAADPANSGEPWTPLFNGRDLEGWIFKMKGTALGEDPLNTVRCVDGCITMDYARYEKFDKRFGHLFYKEKLRNFRLRLEYRFFGEQAPGGPAWAWRNSGVMVLCQDPASMRVDQNFPVCMEAQLLGGNPSGDKPRTTMNLCTLGTSVVYQNQLLNTNVSTTAPALVGDGWVACEVVVINGAVQHRLQGQEVLSYSACQLDPNQQDAKALLAAGSPLMLREGWICLQAESHPVQFRNIELQRLAD